VKKSERILIVDDDQNLRKTLADILKVKGYEIVIAASGAQAVAAAEKQIFNIALIDLKLPDMPGIEVMSRIKIVSPLTETIILTGHASLDTAMEATRQGAFSYILKPYDIDDLLKKIREGIERQRGNEEILRLASFPRLHPSPVIELNASGGVTYANPAAEKLFPDLKSVGSSHPLLRDAGDTISALRAGTRLGVVSHEVEIGESTYELHISYIREVELIRIYMLSVTERVIAEHNRKKADEEIRLHKNHLQELVENKTAEIQQRAVQYQEQKSLLNLILESIPLAIFAKDASDGYKWVMINKCAEEMFGVKRDDILGHVDYDFFPKEESDFFRATDKKVMAGGVLVEIDMETATTPHGVIKVHTIKVPIYDENNQPALLLGIVENVTEKIRVQEDLRIAKDLAEQAVHIKSDFLANMSHEIRTPMNGIIGLTRLLADSNLDRDQQQSVRAILNSGETLLFLLNDILDFSKIEARELALEKLPINLKDTLQNIINLLSPMASRKGLVVKYIYDNDAPLGAIGDPVRIGQIMTNLLGNAIKFTETGHITLSVSAQERKTQGDYLYSFTIEDTGIGMLPEVQGLIFKKFTQSDSSTSRKFGGTGLGLAISKSLTELMGGEISVTSVLGKGSVFTVVLPLHKAKAFALEDNKAKAVQRRLSTAEAFSCHRILIVDDHPINMLFAQKLLGTMGFVRVDDAANGLEALDKIKNGGKDYDLIMMDCQMPEMDGFEASRKIREWESMTAHKRIPIIATTARAMESDRDLCLQAGMDDYLSKPINPDKLHDTLSRWLIEPGKMADIVKQGAPVLAEKGIIDLSCLELFTEGDLDEEKKLADLFLGVGKESIGLLKQHINSKNNDWKNSAHRLKGSAAQIGAHRLSALCLKAEQSPLEERDLILVEIETGFTAISDFFQRRQT